MKQPKGWHNIKLAPREKLLMFGANALTNSELLALFLRTGARGIHVMQYAESLMDRFGSLHQVICADRQALCSVKGMGVSKYTQLQAIGEMAQRFYSSHMMREDALTSPEITHGYLRLLLANREREVFMVLFLDNQHRLIKHQEMFQGTVNSVEVHPREILREALKINAAAIILAHNHPSGSAVPSRADREVTDLVVKACMFLDIRVLDHMVIGAGEYVSFAEKGWL